MLQAGNKLLISHRRLFKEDEPRFFVGEVLDYDTGLVKIRGLTFVWDITGGKFIKKDQFQIKFVSLMSGTVFAYQLPDETNVANVRFESQMGTMKMVDGSGLDMDMAQWPHQGQI